MRRLGYVVECIQVLRLCIVESVDFIYVMLIYLPILSKEYSSCWVIGC